jgi:mono/diheme cytochrome c family protein
VSRACQKDHRPEVCNALASAAVVRDPALPGPRNAPAIASARRKSTAIARLVAIGTAVADRLLMGHPLRTTALAAALALLPAGVAVEAADKPADPGRAMYLRYCGACHGPQGKGDGIAGGLMTPRPADLTQVAKKNGGTFPFQGVMADIDGTKDVRAHGDPVMPVWGEMFRAESAWDMGRRVEVQGKLMLITDYVRSIQAR